jgi:hypothetical protein
MHRLFYIPAFNEIDARNSVLSRFILLNLEKHLDMKKRNKNIRGKNFQFIALVTAVSACALIVLLMLLLALVL